MEILKQTLRLEHELNDQYVISSEIEFAFEEYDDYDEAREEARLLLVETISNGRPGVIDECRRAMGINYSWQQFNDDTERYKELCKRIDKVKFDIATKEEGLRFLLHTENKLLALTQMLKTAGFYREFCNLLEAIYSIKGSESVEEEKEQLS